MPGQSFQQIWIKEMDKIVRSCAEWKTGEGGNVSVFLHHLENLASRLIATVRGAATGFGGMDLPYIIYIAWLTSLLKQEIAGKSNSKKTTGKSISAAMMQAHAAQRQACGETAWQPCCPPGKDWFARAFLLALVKKEMGAVAAACKKMPSPMLAELLFSYSVCADFLAGNSSLFRTRKKLPDGFSKKYVLEIPRRACPACGLASWPVIDFSREVNATGGYTFKCQFCGHPYGLGGISRPLYSGGKRIISTTWPTDKFELDYCQLCGRTRASLAVECRKLEAHHLAPVSEGGEDIPSNILVLCPDCHLEVHKRRDEVSGKDNAS